MDKLVVTCAFIISLFFVANATKFPSICTQTPYPELCNSLAISPQATPHQTPYYVRDATLESTLAQAQHVHNLISTTDTASFDHLTRAAWADCLELYEDTVENLARCADPTTNLNDAQTWLSASYANHETCKNGFVDFKLTSQLESFPFLNSNFSKHLSNSLAINKLTLDSSLVSSNKQIKNRRLLHESDPHGFPAWVSAADRKLLQSSGPKANVVVAQDGSGNYKTISAAMAAAKGNGGSGRFVIYVKRGVYRENVVVTKSMSNIMLVGDGIGATVVTGSNSAEGSTTFRSATVGVSGDRFIAQDITFENTAGPEKHQAVALRSSSDFSVFYRCSFKGYQDTLYVYSKRQFYRECEIEGTIDFIFGDAVAVLQNCNINIRKPLGNQFTTVTAQGRSDPNENTGIIIHNSQISGSGGSRNYLGRPWKQYSRTVIMRTGIGGLINPTGWLPWSGNFALNTLYYGEYANTGPGAGTGGRVKWGGFHVLTSPAEAGKFSVGNFLAGNSWIPSTGVPFTAGL